jgi:putative adenylate-forming enzyme
LRRWLEHDLPEVDFYHDAPPRLEALPVIDKTTVMSNFAAFNRGRITAEEGWCALANNGEGGHEGVSIGSSTGTSGNRTLYAITNAERYRWLGTILAKTVPQFLVRPERVAVILAQNSALYDSARQANRLKLKFYDLRQGIETWIASLEAFAPTTIVAPPRVLRHLAEHAEWLAPRRLYAGAETLDPVDREVIEARFGITLGQIYMASEGLFAVTCSHGRLHLAEDAIFFEFETVTDGLVTPLVTGFRRQFQIMARYRMNDLLRLSGDPCPCGSPLRVVDEVIGRMDDVFVFERANGPPVLVTPDVMRNAVLDAARDITDFRILREEPDKITLVLQPNLSAASVDAACSALAEVFTRAKLSPDIQVRRDAMAMAMEPFRKLRRVECRLKTRG